MTYDVIIIGGGPGGITAGIYSCRQGMNTLLITKEFGGQMLKKATEVCNYPGFGRISGAELIKKFADQAKELGITFKMEDVAGISKEGEIFTVKTNSGEYLAYSVIIATGASPRTLDIDGEKEFTGRGVSYCVTCDGPLFNKKDIAIIGGGNAGFEAAIFMSRFANKVYILEFADEIKANWDNIEIVKKTENIKVITSAQAKEVKGDKFVEALAYLDKKSEEEKELKVNGVFIEIGGKPATDFVSESLVDFTLKREIMIDTETYATKTPGLFAAGDANCGKYKQIVVAAGEGCKAALSAYEYVYDLRLKKGI